MLSQGWPTGEDRYCFHSAGEPSEHPSHMRMGEGILLFCISYL